MLSADETLSEAAAISEEISLKTAEDEASAVISELLLAVSVPLSHEQAKTASTNTQIMIFLKYFIRQPH